MPVKIILKIFTNPAPGNGIPEHRPAEQSPAERLSRPGSRNETVQEPCRFHRREYLPDFMRINGNNHREIDVIDGSVQRSTAAAGSDHRGKSVRDSGMFRLFYVSGRVLGGKGDKRDR